MSECFFEGKNITFMYFFHVIQFVFSARNNFKFYNSQIVDFADKISFYVMGCVSFFKSSRDDIKANAALFTGE